MWVPPGYFSRKILKNGYPFLPKSPLKMGRVLRLEHYTPVQLKSEYPPGLIYHAEPEMNPGAGGYLVERWVRGCAAQIGCFFGISGLPMAPFLFENWFRYRSRFCKMHNFRWIFPLVYRYSLSKSTTFASKFTWQKVLVGLKKGPSRNKWFRHRFANLHLPWVSYRVVVKTMGHTSVPNSSLSTPRDEPRLL